MHFNDIGKAHTLKKEEFTSRLSGFVLANLEEQKDLSYEPVSDAMKAFVWGNQWIDQSDNLPGLLSGGEIAMQAGIAIGVALISMFLPGIGTAAQYGITMALAMAAVSIGAGQLAGTVATICVMKGACSQSQGMILAIALSVGLSLGTQALAGWAGGAAAASTAAPQVSGLVVKQSLLQIIWKAIENAYTAVVDTFTNLIKSIIDMVEAFYNAVVDLFTKSTSLLSFLKNLGRVLTLGQSGTSSGASKEAIRKAAFQSLITTTPKQVVEVFVGGFIVGVAQGYVKLEITKMVEKALGDDMDPILKQAISGVVASIGAEIATVVTADFLSTLTGSSKLSEMLGVGKYEEVKRTTSTGTKVGTGVYTFKLNLGFALGNTLQSIPLRLLQAGIGVLARELAAKISDEAATDTQLSEAIGQLAGSLGVVLYKGLTGQLGVSNREIRESKDPNHKGEYFFVEGHADKNKNVDESTLKPKDYFHFTDQDVKDPVTGDVKKMPVVKEGKFKGSILSQGNQLFVKRDFWSTLSATAAQGLFASLLAFGLDKVEGEDLRKTDLGSKMSLLQSRLISYFSMVVVDSGVKALVLWGNPAQQNTSKGLVPGEKSDGAAAQNPPGPNISHDIPAEPQKAKDRGQDVEDILNLLGFPEPRDRNQDDEDVIDYLLSEKPKENPFTPGEHFWKSLVGGQLSFWSETARDIFTFGKGTNMFFSDAAQFVTYTDRLAGFMGWSTSTILTQIDPLEKQLNTQLQEGYAAIDADASLTKEEKARQKKALKDRRDIQFKLGVYDSVNEAKIVYFVDSLNTRLGGGIIDQENYLMGGISGAFKDMLEWAVSPALKSYQAKNIFVNYLGFTYRDVVYDPQPGGSKFYELRRARPGNNTPGLAFQVEGDSAEWEWHPSKGKNIMAADFAAGWMDHNFKQSGLSTAELAALGITFKGINFNNDIDFNFDTAAILSDPHISRVHEAAWFDEIGSYDVTAEEGPTGVDYSGQIFDYKRGLVKSISNGTYRTYIAAGIKMAFEEVNSQAKIKNLGDELMLKTTTLTQAQAEQLLNDFDKQFGLVHEPYDGVVRGETSSGDNIGFFDKETGQHIFDIRVTEEQGGGKKLALFVDPNTSKKSESISQQIIAQVKGLKTTKVSIAQYQEAVIKVGENGEGDKIIKPLAGVKQVGQTEVFADGQEVKLQPRTNMISGPEVNSSGLQASLAANKIQTELEKSNGKLTPEQKKAIRDRENKIMGGSLTSPWAKQFYAMGTTGLKPDEAVSIKASQDPLQKEYDENGNYTVWIAEPNADSLAYAYYAINSGKINKTPISDFLLRRQKQNKK